MARLASFLYFRKIFLINADRIPRKGPLMLVCNHPSSFFEACLLAVLLPRSLYFLTRGDFFKNRGFSWFLRQTHQIPIFRSQDGIGKLRNNPETFIQCFKALSEHKAILMFPEMFTIVEKRLRPLQKGAARLALGALQHVPAISILPIGMTFSDPARFRSLVTIKCGTPIPVLRPPEFSEERVAVTQMTAQLEQAMRSLIVHIEKPEREPVYDALQILYFNSERIPVLPVISRSSGFVDIEKRIADTVNDMQENSEQALREDILRYTQELNRRYLKDRFLQCNMAVSSAGRFLLIPLTLVIGIGKLVISLPVWLVRSVLNSMAPRRPFYGPLKWIMGFFAVAIWSVVCLISGYLLFGVKGVFLVSIVLLSGYLALQIFHDLPLIGLVRLLKMKRGERKALMDMRKRILEYTF